MPGMWKAGRMSVERVMPDGYVLRCSGPPTCKYCAEDWRIQPIDIVDRIDELVNWQLTKWMGD